MLISPRASSGDAEHIRAAFPGDRERDFRHIKFDDLYLRPVFTGWKNASRLRADLHPRLLSDLDRDGDPPWNVCVLHADVYERRPPVGVGIVCVAGILEQGVACCSLLSRQRPCPCGPG